MELLLFTFYSAALHSDGGNATLGMLERGDKSRNSQ